MAAIDWIAMGIPLVLIVIIVLYSRRHLKSVADYMAGGRCAGRYMLCVARGEMGAGAVVFVAMFEIFYRAGFTITWWQWLTIPVGLLVSITGFVIYRFRETRALTLAQFFEIRYGRLFRIFNGFIGFFAGIMNFGIIPAVGARFFVYFLGLSPSVSLWGITIPTYVLIMAILLMITVIITVSGGQITVMLSDCASGLMDQWLFLVVIAAVLCLFKWSDAAEVMLNRPPGQSMMNPFDSLQVENFNLAYVLMTIFIGFYGTMAWQNASAYNSAASTPHESRMGNVLGRWREFSKRSAITVLVLGAIVFLNHPDFSGQSAEVQGVLDQIGNSQIREQMRVPVALSLMLPAGIKGILCAILITGIFGGDSTHLHSWGSMFVQDVILPLRKTPMNPQQHIRYLRLAMIGVGVFAFLFGIFFSQTEYVVMWFQITMAIYVGGAGAVIIGGLYWKKGTTAAAWTAMLTGATLSCGGIIVRQLIPGFPFNGVQISFGATLLALGTYVVVSLLTCKKDFNLERMLHRGKYAVEEDLVKEDIQPFKKRFRLSKLIGINEKFSRGDRWIAGGIFWWGILWLAVMIIGGIWNFLQPWNDQIWSIFWLWAGIILPVAIGVLTTVWFTCGVLRDIRGFFSALEKERVDIFDDGRVFHDPE